MNFFTDNINAFLSLMRTFKFTDFLDILLMTFIIYSFIKLIRETRASQLVKGIIVLLITYFIAYQLNLRMLSTLLNKFFEFGIIALLVVFQPELRRALEQIGRSKIGNYLQSNSSFSQEQSGELGIKHCIEAVVDAILIMQQTKTGALLVFERKTKLGDIIDTGTILKATPTVALITNIFFNKAPLHDGAMILKNASIYAAGCILPLTKNEEINSEFGTRHRAALGISENSDALAIVVSEETGNISVALNGRLTTNYSRETLQKKLENIMFADFDTSLIKRQILGSFKRGKKNEKK